MTNNNDEQIQRAMVVVAHADDAEWGCSGTVARWCAEGIHVVYVICTDGSKGTSDATKSLGEVIDSRRTEQEDAGRVLGLDEVVFLGFPDAYLQSNLELRKAITRQIRIHRPDVLVCMNPVRNLDGDGYIDHPDHFASGDAAMGAVYPAARDPLTFPELLTDEGLEPHKVREVWIMGRSHPDHFVDVTEHIETAVEALRAHRSQVSPEAADQHLREWRRRDGPRLGVEYVEVFKRFRLG